MSQYVYQRTGGPLVYWTPGTVPRQSRAADARSMGQEPPAPGADFGMGCGGDCGCKGCGGAAKTYPMGMAGGYPEYGRPVKAIAIPRGNAQRYVSTLGTVPFIPGAPEPLTDTITPGDVTGLIDPYPANKSSSSIPWGTVILGGLALAVAWPHIKKLAK